MYRFFQIAALTLLLAILGSYLGDAVLLQVKVHQGTAYRVITMDQVLTTPLKGQKEEYDLNEKVPVTCVRSLFHQLGYPPCWWVERRNPQAR